MILTRIGIIDSNKINLPIGNLYTSPTITGSDVSIVSQSPFLGGGNSYSFITSINSFIDVNSDESWAFRTEDFTIEWFSYQLSTAGFQRVLTVDDFPSIDIGISIEESTFYYWANSSFRYSSSGSTLINTWYHWAIVRQNGVTKVYRNGSLRGSQITDTNDINNIVDKLTIGNENSPSTLAAFNGYLTNIRIVKGLAVYTGDFTVPTSELSVTSSSNPYGGLNTQEIPTGYTKLLLVP